jgi:hypothetical protein
MNLLTFISGTPLHTIAGGALCVRYLRAAIADDISPQLRRMHADMLPGELHTGRSRGKAQPGQTRNGRGGSQPEAER